MRRLNDVKKVADLIVSNFKFSEFEMTRLQDDSIDIRVPYLPSSIVSKVSNDIYIGVFPHDSTSVLVNVYKL